VTGCPCYADRTPSMITTVSSVLGAALAGAGRTVEGLALLARGVRGQKRIGNRFHLARRYREWADSLVLAGELPDAQRAADTALSPARAMSERGTEAETLRVLGAIAAAGCSADPGASATLYQQGLALAVELGMRPSVAHCHLGLGKLYRRTGDQAKAREHLTTAATMYREMDMGFWLEKAEVVFKEVPK
jgi:hypothetical protein